MSRIRQIKPFRTEHDVVWAIVAALAARGHEPRLEVRLSPVDRVAAASFAANMPVSDVPYVVVRPT